MNACCSWEISLNTKNVIRIHPPLNMNVSTNFYGNPSNSFWDISFSTPSSKHYTCKLSTTGSHRLFFDDYCNLSNSTLTPPGPVFLCPLAPDGKFFWGNPSEVGTFDPSCNCYRGGSWGWMNFVKHFDLKRRNYLKNDDLIIFADFDG